RRWTSAAFLDRGEADVDGPGTAGADLGDHLRQPMQRLRTEHDVDERRSLQDRLALLARDAASDPDDGVRLVRLELAPAAEQREHLLLRLLTDRARVEQQDVGVVRARRRARAALPDDHTGHPGRG